MPPAATEAAAAAVSRISRTFLNSLELLKCYRTTRVFFARYWLYAENERDSERERYSSDNAYFVMCNRTEVRVVLLESEFGRA